MTTQDNARTEQFAQEIQNRINDWTEEFDPKSDDQDLMKFKLESISDEIEKLLVQYSLDIGCDDTVYEVPISLCLDSPIGLVEFKGKTFGSSQNIRTWVKHLSGAESSEHVITAVRDKKLIEIIALYWNTCLSRMYKFDELDI